MSPWTEESWTPLGDGLTVLRLRPPPRPSATGLQLDLDWLMKEGGGGRGIAHICDPTSSLWLCAAFASAGLLLTAAAAGSVPREAQHCSLVSSPNPKPGFNASCLEGWIFFIMTFPSPELSLFILSAFSHLAVSVQAPTHK